MANNSSGEIAAQALDTIVNDGFPGTKLSSQVCAASGGVESVLIEAAMV